MACKSMDESIFKDSSTLVLVDTNSLALIGQGNTAEIYDYEGNTVIKLFRDGFPVQGVLKEYYVNGRVQDEYPMMPKALNVVTCKDRVGILYEKIEGHDMFSAIIENPLSIRKMTKKLALIHADIHEKRIGNIVSVKDKLIEEIERTNDLSDDEKNKVIQLLYSLPNKDGLCHFDYHPGNIMMTGSEYKVLDWMTACTGDPASDIARTWLLLKFGELRNNGFLARIRLEIVKFFLRRLYLKESIRLLGVTKEDIRKWIVPVAAARLSEWLTDNERQKLLTLIRTGLKT